MANPEHVHVVQGRTASVQAWNDAHPEEHLDLTYADLRGVQVEGGVLRGANLEGAQLSDAVLTGVDLQDAWLVGCDLSDCLLMDSNLSGTVAAGANLRRARLNRADLRGTDLSNAFLQGAELNGARSGGTSWSSRELSQSVGLDDIVHLGPDHVDLDLILPFAAELPVAFLQSCGIPQRAVAMLPELSEETPQVERTVVWFVEEDAEFANRLIRELRKSGVRCWPAPATTVPTTRSEIRRRVGCTDSILLCLSAAAAAHPQLQREAKAALLREEHPGGIDEQRRQVLKLIDIGGTYAGNDLPQVVSELDDRVIAGFGDSVVDDTAIRNGIEPILLSLTIPAADDSVFVPPMASGTYVARRKVEPAQCATISLDELERLPGQSSGLIPGFRRLVRNDGGNSVWFDYRGEKQPTHHLRQLSAGNVLEWETAPVPKELGNSLACFVWAGSFGALNEPETAGFSLLLRGENQLTFDLTKDRHIWRNESGTVALVFDPRWTSPTDAAGFFYLGVSPDLVAPGKTCRIGICTVGIDSERWVGVMPMPELVERQVRTETEDSSDEQTAD